MDHTKSTKNLHFNGIQCLIVGEADRILDLGFEKDITVILNAVNAECQKRQNVLLSATLTEGELRSSCGLRQWVPLLGRRNSFSPLSAYPGGPVNPRSLAHTLGCMKGLQPALAVALPSP